MRSLSEIEQVIQEEFDAMPESFRDENADEFLLFINALRKARFNVACQDCDECGYLFPMDDLTLTAKSDGKGYWVCGRCKDLEAWVSQVFKGWVA